MNTYKLPNLSLMAIAIVAATASITSAQAADFKAHAAGAPLQLGDLPASPLRAQLEALPTDVRSTALSKLKDIHISSADLPHLQVDKSGNIYFADNFSTEFIQPAKITTKSEAATPAMIYSAFTLHSKPDATNVLVLDFDGYTITDTKWNDSYNEDYWDAKPFDTDEDESTLSTDEIEAIKSIWRRVAEDYAPFNIDITTEYPSSFNRNTGHVLITKGMDENGVYLPKGDSVGGLAYVNVWGNEDFASASSPAFVYIDRLGYDTKAIAEAASHEAGHNLGLSHDGSSTERYYHGHGEGNISWAPIMGGSYSNNVTQWSKGEYYDANNLQDDIAIITNKLTRRADDHGNTITAATPLKIVSGKVSSSNPINDPTNSNKANKGIIHSRTDVDVFSFKTIGGKVTLNALPLRETTDTRLGNMDIKMTIRNASNNVVATVNPALNTHASFTGNLAAGTYYVIIDGVGAPDSPYSDYGTLGQYFINGTIPQ